MTDAQVCSDSIKVISLFVSTCVCENNLLLRTMIFGRVAYLGVLSRRSAVSTAGVLILIVSSPPSISLTTLTLPPSNDTSDAKVPCNKENGQIKNGKMVSGKWGNSQHCKVQGKRKILLLHLLANL